MKTSTKIIIVVAVVIVVGVVAYYFYSKKKAKNAPAEAEKKAIAEGEKEIAKGIENGDLIVVPTFVATEKPVVVASSPKTPLIKVKDKKTLTVKK